MHVSEHLQGIWYRLRPGNTGQKIPDWRDILGHGSDLLKHPSDLEVDVKTQINPWNESEYAHSGVRLEWFRWDFVELLHPLVEVS